MSAGFRIWLKFNAVGMMGVGVQLSILVLLESSIGLHYLAATGIAVEIAILHNFIWHERWTWMERTRVPRAGLPGRLVRFHVANGLISICGNLTLMWLFVSYLGLEYFIAGILAIAICASANFWASDRLVFKRIPV